MKGKLGGVRSAISIYYADNEGLIPMNIDTSLVPKYIDKFPVLKATSLMLGDHTGFAYNSVSGMWYNTSNTANFFVNMANFETMNGDSGGWGYYANQFDGFYRLNILCTHLDTKGTVYSTY